MDEALISNWNARITNADTVYIIGDLLWKTSRAEEYLSRLKGKKILVTGNHDSSLLNNEIAAKYCKEIHSFLECHIDGHQTTLCHYPMVEWKGSRKEGTSKLGYLIYGHIHGNIKYEYKHLFSLPNALNAGVDINGYVPVTFDELTENNAKYYAEWRK
ncbi:MAG: metallophosphoesterase family protein [Clostridia bacterium]|nr:metallophosphoesterase family protein [Clostridia bacterium]